MHPLCGDTRWQSRPYGPALHTTKPNEVLHFDYLMLPEDEDTHNNTSLSGYGELYSTADPYTTLFTVSLLSWFHRYGVVKQWVTDQGTHFKNEVIDHLAKSIGANHHFTAAYCPWANGTVEVVNRLLLKCMRAVLSERRMSPSIWETILDMVQAALNHQPSGRLSDRAPITAFTGLPVMTPLAAIFTDDKVVDMDATTLWTKQQHYLEDAAEALASMHRDVAQMGDQRQIQARARQAVKAKPPNFTIGDFVLTASVIPVPNKLSIKWRDQNVFFAQ
ncbi:Hypothetical protein PHPALM_9095 [Phytophthora palmivora]|uniref:Integrase catalytic domain-containing protein n=1 Tax=Phytophthora palmivora TaxID=4796 RepID=A0A2P4Y862_9STRA|nr:Hypothetical protein PHPALM_9095 [Phytophthora palmivora]